MKCPLCRAETEYNETHSEMPEVTGETFPYFCMDFWCKKGHLVQAVANRVNVGWSVTLFAESGDELYEIWFSPYGKYLDYTDLSPASTN